MTPSDFLPPAKAIVKWFPNSVRMNFTRSTVDWKLSLDAPSWSFSLSRPGKTVITAVTTVIKTFVRVRFWLGPSISLHSWLSGEG